MHVDGAHRGLPDSVRCGQTPQTSVDGVDDANDWQYVPALGRTPPLEEDAVERTARRDPGHPLPRPRHRGGGARAASAPRWSATPAAAPRRSSPRPPRPTWCWPARHPSSPPRCSQACAAAASSATASAPTPSTSTPPARTASRVARVSDYGTEAVAFHAVATACALVRRLPEADRAVRAGSWGFADLRPLHLPSASPPASSASAASAGRPRPTSWDWASRSAPSTSTSTSRPTSGVRAVDLDTLARDLRRRPPARPGQPGRLPAARRRRAGPDAAGQRAGQHRPRHAHRHPGPRRRPQGRTPRTCGARRLPPGACRPGASPASRTRCCSPRTWRGTPTSPRRTCAARPPTRPPGCWPASHCATPSSNPPAPTPNAREPVVTYDLARMTSPEAREAMARSKHRGAADRQHRAARPAPAQRHRHDGRRAGRAGGRRAARRDLRAVLPLRRHPHPRRPPGLGHPASRDLRGGARGRLHRAGQGRRGDRDPGQLARRQHPLDERGRHRPPGQPRRHLHRRAGLLHRAAALQARRAASSPTAAASRRSRSSPTTRAW